MGLIQGALDRRLPGADVRVWDRRQSLIDAARDADILLPSNTPIGGEIVAAAPHLALIQQPAAGIDVVDCDAAAEAGIPVANAPGANHQSVAEAALYLILALARRAKEAARAFEKGEIGAVPGMELSGKTLGIVGRGRSGAALAAIARGFGMEIAFVGRSSAPEAWEELWAGSDVISLHCPLDDTTRGLVGERALARVRPGALLVNCARGAIVDRDAAERALSRGALGGLGLDVFWEEPWNPGDPLFQRDDVVVTPHTAGATREALGRIAATVAENAARVWGDDAPLHRVA